ncbi:2-C-methyl-D-erythritol 4-phosphate cytidylyltransferase/2-C-methyl-D-erythritol 2,4-cyclodiphosphate synthase [Diaminobutyricimonas aerilata]|uniref:Bifunctional enzyme IspD/IspF n=1 Tax=Diaminobutyricimonas aerilata TaxID=1162967 RepID=A0A2M9CMC9_9MICO|nr:2-C-methyl-D-erythritol 4-phosphate cytidylyltransferase [Diaminobutyricimonas aerilata]PJJ73049.1 2-C-methyl-D-erythritol 4-phosphate cytidylyltransferase/2-C-methyl-D-erythritol 2,4-cyclodiphosphate synthase [Diaminobutyricimonas aerilata]
MGEPEHPDEPALGIIIVAAGSGTRLGRREPKAFVSLAGRSILAHALEGVLQLAEPARIVIVAPRSRLDAADAVVAQVAGAARGYVSVVSGGESRQASVAAGLAALGEAPRVVLVHDAARCLTPTDAIQRVVDAVRETGAGVIPVQPVADTIKRVDPAGAVLGTVDRSELVHVQTPQGFPRELIVDAYARAEREHTDDAALVAAAGYPVTTVAGDDAAFKITTPWDLRRAETMLRRPVGIRTGIGIDVHAYDDADPLWLGGLHWPDEPGLAGHSDGDAVSHAICDALLSAAGLGDIGSRFGTSDERYRKAHGDVFLRATVDLVNSAGLRIGNVAVQIVGNRPRLASRRAEMERRLTDLVGAPVSVSATTSDGLGFTGRGEGLTAVATALVLDRDDR